MHDDEEVVTAPLWIGCHKLRHDGVYLLDNIHAEKFFQFNLPGCNDGADDLQGCSVKLDVAHLEILEQYLNKAELFEDENECGVTLHNYRE